MQESYLAPIHGYTDFAFRMLCRRYGAGGAVVPLINATAIARDSSRLICVDAGPDETDLGLQLVGRCPRDLGLAAKAVSVAFPSLGWLNLNCGCPSSRTVGCGGGSAMLDDPASIVEAVSIMKRHSHCPVSVKLRMKGSMAQTSSLLKDIERAGADFVVIHGRTRAQGYSGRCDWEGIKALREGIGIPVIGNGDIECASEGRRLIREGYCDSFMVGRAAMSNPMLFSDGSPDGPDGRLRLLEEYVAISREHGVRLGLKDVKAKAIALSNGFRGARSLRNRIMSAETVDYILEMRERMQYEER